MTHQPEPVIDSVQDHHVESVILSGSPFVSSILGPGAYRIAPLTVPAFYTNPVISGLLVIGASQNPPLLTCDGGHFNSSPRAVITYSWQVDQVAIAPAETGSTYAPIPSDITKAIRCEVTITNSQGNVSAFSNEITITALTPTEVFELDVYAIQGFDAAPGRIEVNDLTMTFMSGIANNVLTEVNNNDAMAITGFASLEASAISATDAYAVFLPTPLTDLVVVNGDAENASMADWTMDLNTVLSVTTATGYSTTGREGLRFFQAEQALGLGVDAQMSQVILIPGGDLTDVDTGRCYCVADIIHDSEEGRDHIEITLEALNAADGVIGTATQVFISNPSGDAFWRQDNTLDNPLSLPTLTRKVKIIVLFKAHDTLGGPDNNGYLDNIRLRLFKIT